MNSPRLYNGGLWTKARFNSFIKSALRAASLKWPPKWEVLKKAFVGVKVNPKTGRNSKHYRCNCCKKEFPTSEVEVNHKTPVVPPEGIKTWDEVIDRLFCEEEGLEVLCRECHKEVTKKEKQIATAVKRKEKNKDE